MKTSQILLFLSIYFVSCNTSSKHETEQKAEPINETTKQQMFNLAYIEASTAPYYVVATIKDKNTGEIRNICTEAPFLERALYREHEKDYSYSFNLDTITTRCFELSKDSALWDISFDLYTESELNSFSKTINIDSILAVMKKEKHSKKHFTESRKFQHMFAHTMFNYGVIMRRGCVAGNNCSMVLFDSTKTGKTSEDLDWDYY